MNLRNFWRIILSILFYARKGFIVLNFPFVGTTITCCVSITNLCVTQHDFVYVLLRMYQIVSGIQGGSVDSERWTTAHATVGSNRDRVNILSHFICCTNHVIFVAVCLKQNLSVTLATGPMAFHYHLVTVRVVIHHYLVTLLLYHLATIPVVCRDHLATVPAVQQYHLATLLLIPLYHLTTIPLVCSDHLATVPMVPHYLWPPYIVIMVHRCHLVTVPKILHCQLVHRHLTILPVVHAHSQTQSIANCEPKAHHITKASES